MTSTLLGVHGVVDGIGSMVVTEELCWLLVLPNAVSFLSVSDGASTPWLPPTSPAPIPIAAPGTRSRVGRVRRFARCHGSGANPILRVFEGFLKFDVTTDMGMRLFFFHQLRWGLILL